jgi:hypothetical protein
MPCESRLLVLLFFGSGTLSGASRRMLGRAGVISGGEPRGVQRLAKRHIGCSQTDTVDWQTRRM